MKSFPASVLSAISSLTPEIKDAGSEGTASRLEDFFMKYNWKLPASLLSSTLTISKPNAFLQRDWKIKRKENENSSLNEEKEGSVPLTPS
jgi:hypothetical protein